MTREEFIKLQKKHRQLEEKMTEEELAALNKARRRHFHRVRDEILTSYEVNKRNKEKKTDIEL